MPVDAIEDPELLGRIQRHLLHILRDFDRACRVLDIPYSIYGGTMIGAVRHGGFIPWDDDVDVFMTRDNYERFLREAPDILGDEYQLDNTRSVPHYPFMFTKLGLRGTLIVPEFAAHSAYRMPICMDILPLDRVADRRSLRRQSRRTWLWGRLLFLTGTPKPMLIDTAGMKRTAIHAATTSAYWALRAFHATPRFIQHRWEMAARRDEDATSNVFTDFSMRDPLTWCVRLDEIEPVQDIQFESITVRIAPSYDAMLRRTYGDYMELPPAEQRRNHKPIKVRFRDDIE